MRNIEIALNKYFKYNNGDELIRELTTPNILLEEGLLPRDSELLLEAEIIIDSLNAYNNNIDNMDREDQLYSIPIDSPLYSWRSLVLAIKEFYNSNYQQMVYYINEINPLAPLKPIYQGLLNKNNIDLYSSNMNLESDIDSFKDIINNNLTDLYSQTLTLLLSSLELSNTHEFNNSLLTIIEDSISQIPLEIIESTLLKNVDYFTVNRLLAISLVFEYPIQSIKYWIKLIECRNYSNFYNIEFQAILSIIRDITKSLVAEKYKISKEDETELAPFFKKLYFTLDVLIPRDIKISKNPLTTLKRYLNIKLETKEKTSQDKNNAVQKELF